MRCSERGCEFEIVYTEGHYEHVDTQGVVVRHMAWPRMSKEDQAIFSREFFGVWRDEEVEHQELPAPLEHSFQCSCGALSVGTAADPALFADHLNEVKARG